jgi:DNA-binding NtrC family response regulator
VLSILIIDDDADQRGVLEDALGDRYEITTAGDGPAALAVVTATPERFDLVITDLRMPGMTGVDVKQALTDLSVNLPMILMSSDQLVGKLAAGAGFFDFLTKPLSFDQLEAAIARVAAEKARRISSLEMPATAQALPEAFLAIPGDDDPGSEGP